MNNKIRQDKDQYNLDRQTATISALLSGNVGKHEFIAGKDFLPEKDFLKKAAAIKRFEYFLFSKEFKMQTSVAEKQYQKFDNAFESNKKEEVKTKNLKNCTNSNLVYNNYFTFYKCDTIKEFTKRSLDSKVTGLREFKDKLELFYYEIMEIKPNREDHIKDLEKEKLCLIQLLNYLIIF